MNISDKKSTNLAALIVSVFLVVFLVACGSTPGEQELPKDNPDIGIPESEINQKIKILAPEGWNKFNTKKSIALSVEAISQEMITFNPNDTRIFIYSDTSWVEVDNKMTYEPSDFTYLLDPYEKDFLSRFGFTTVFPDFPDSSKPVTVRIFVFGYINKDGMVTDQKVASYIDLNLEP